MVVQRLKIIFAFVLYLTGNLVPSAAQIIPGQPISHSSNLDSAILDAEVYLKNAGERNDTNSLFNALCYLCEQYTRKSYYSKAEKNLDLAKQIAVLSGNETRLAFVYLEFANLKKYEGKYSDALDHYLKAEQIFEKRKDWKNIPRVQLELAEFYRKTGHYDKAGEYLLAAFSIFENENLNDTVLLIRLYNRAAAIHNESDPDIKNTLHFSHKALSLATRIKDKNLMATSQNELGFTFKNLLNNDSSEYYYTEAEKNWFSVGNYADGVHAMNNRAMLYAHNNFSRDQVFKIYFDIIDKVEKYQIDYPLNDVYHYLYLENIWSGDTGRAIGYFEKFHEAELINEKKLHDINMVNIREKYESEKIKNAYQKVSDELTKSNQDIINSREEKLKLMIFLSVLIVALVVIITLAYKLRGSNKELQGKNKEKDSLIQEIHHRVKNNLQFISSLVNMQMKASESADEIHTLSDASRRINAMALVHEMLYNQNEQNGISAKLYLEELIDSLKDLVHSDDKPILFKTEIQDVNFTVQEAVSLGMITSEIISNSMKHAFAKTSAPTVTIKLEETENRKIVYTISDNGKGFDKSKKRKNSLGLRLIDIFSRQLKGSYEIEGKDGFTYTITFHIK